MHIFNIFISISVFFFLRLPITQSIYGYFSSWYLAFFIALCISFLISKLIYNILYNIKNHKVFSKYYNQYLDIYIIDYLFNLSLRFRYVVVAVKDEVLNTCLILIYQTTLSTAPALSPQLINKMELHAEGLIRKGDRIRHRMRLLENVCGALDRDRTHHTHGSLHDAFKEYFETCRKEIRGDMAEEFATSIYYSHFGDYNHGHENKLINIESNMVYYNILVSNFYRMFF